METSTQKGFGSVVSILPGRVIVLQTLPGTPSAKSGLSPGDEILAINGYIIGQLDLEQLPQLAGSLPPAARAPGRAAAWPRRIAQLHAHPRKSMQSPSVDRASSCARVSAISGSQALKRRPRSSSRRRLRNWAATTWPAWCWTCATIPADW